jgi:hypothetical protein
MLEDVGPAYSHGDGEDLIVVHYEIHFDETVTMGARSRRR